MSAKHSIDADYSSELRWHLHNDLSEQGGPLYLEIACGRDSQVQMRLPISQQLKDAIARADVFAFPEEAPP